MSRIVGTRFDDTLRATPEPGDTLLGGAGNDTFIFFAPGLGDIFVGGGGQDRLEGQIRVDEGEPLADALSGLTFRGGAGRDVIDVSLIVESDDINFRFADLGFRASKVEEVAITLVNDLGPGDVGRITVAGTGGSETLVLRTDGFNETFSVINMGGGDDTVIFEDFATVRGGAGNDTIVHNASTDGVRMLGQGGDDTISTTGTAGAERVKGGGGADRILLETNFRSFDADVVSGNAGPDTFVIDPISRGQSGAIITDFRSRTDTIEFDNDGVSPDDVLFVNGPEEVGSEIGTIYIDVSVGIIYHFGAVLIDLDGATIRPGDLDFSIA